MNPHQIAFCSFVALGIIAYAIIWFDTRGERKAAKEAKLKADREAKRQEYFLSEDLTD